MQVAQNNIEDVNWFELAILKVFLEVFWIFRE